MDDVLVHGKTVSGHDKRPASKSFTNQAESWNDLEQRQVLFLQKSIMFLGQLIDSSGIRSDPGKVKAIQTMLTPNNITELRGFLGMVNQLNNQLS